MSQSPALITDARLADMAIDQRNALLESIAAALANDQTERRIERAADQSRWPD